LDDERYVVVPFGSSDRDIKSAEKCEKVLRMAFRRHNMANKIDRANMWSEMTGTAFYKLVWNPNAGKVIGKNPIGNGDLHEGDIDIIVCSPYEIFPDNLSAADVENLGSIIHAKPMSVESVFKIWGVEVDADDVDANTVMVIERYKDGEIIVVAGGKILDTSTYNCGFPFVRQTSESVPDSFYGRSVIERAIPVQKALNAVKNRKTEFLNRLSCGVIIAEEGSIDAEMLENEGLAPGTIIEFRAGSVPPRFMEGNAIPAELEREEERLLNELARITGGSDIIREGFSNISGVAMDIIVAQDKMKIKRASQSGKEARLKLAQMILRMYKKYASAQRLERITNGRIVELITWSKSDITSEEVEYEGGK